MKQIVIIIHDTEEGGPKNRPTVQIQPSPIRPRKPRGTVKTVLEIFGVILSILASILALYTGLF